jgi:hypothetical protein
MRAKSVERIKAERYIHKYPDATAGTLVQKCGVALATAYKVLEEASQPQTTEFKTQEHNIIQGYTGKQYKPMDFTPPMFEETPQTFNEAVAEMFKEDLVNSPAHYTAGGIETIDFIEAKNLGYHLGNAVKYISRAGHKGNTLQDLEKAQWYLTREINNLKGKE